MFKILTLKDGVDDQLQSIQNQYQIDAVQYLGNDSSFNKYLLVQYDTLPPNQTPSSGSVPSEPPGDPVQLTAKK